MHMWRFIILSIIVILSTTIISALRYKIIVNSKKEKISFAGAFSVHTITQFSAIIVPFKMGALVTKPTITKLVSDIKISKSFSMMLFEQIIDISWQMVSLPFLLIFIGEQTILNDIWIELIVIGIFILMILFIYKKRAGFISFLWRFKKFLPKKIRKFGKKHNMTETKINEMAEMPFKYFSSKKLLFLVAIPTVLIIILNPLVLLFLLPIFSVNLGYIPVFLILWTSCIIGRFSGIPSGFVSRDLSMAAFLIIFGVDPILSTQITLLYRTITLAMVITLGIITSLHIGFHKIISSNN